MPVLLIAIILGIVEGITEFLPVSSTGHLILATRLLGFAQCLAMVPGVSRSGATIMGALSLGVERRTAAEFSFFLAVPTMLGATTLEAVKHRHEILSGAGVGFGLIAVGFVVSFIVALVVVRAFVHYISRHGFAPFAWYRIAAGIAALVWLSLGH